MDLITLASAVVSICFGSRFIRNRTVSTILAPVSTRIGLNREREREKKKKANQCFGRRTARQGKSSASAATLEPHRAF